MESALSSAVTVTLDTTPPVVDMGALPAFTNAACVDVSWQGEDAMSGIASYDVGVQQDGGAWTLWQAWVDLTSLPYCPASNGMYGFRARARDRAGNAGAWPPSAQVTTTVDRTPPQAVLALSENSPYAHISGDRVYYNPAGGVFTVTATMTDTPAGLQQVVFPATVSAGGSYPLNGASSATVSHDYIFALSSIESGLDFPVTVSDRAGNVVTATFDVERDATAPAVTVNVPARIYTATIPVSWTVSELGAGASGVYSVSVMTDTGPLQLWLSGVTSTSASLAGELGHRYTFVVTTTDNVSNAGQGSAETIVTQVTKYYYIGSSRVAMRQGSEVTYLHADHLGTVSIATNASQAVLARTLHMPYGSVRWASGTMPTDYGFTGMKDPGLGLVYMHARYYSSWVGRFVSADTIVPQWSNPQTLNRYSYVMNNPLRYRDPTGHDADCGIGDATCRRLVALERRARNVYGVTFTGGRWGYDEMSAVVNATSTIDQQFRNVVAADAARAERLAVRTGESAADLRRLGIFNVPGEGVVFRAVYGFLTFNHDPNVGVDRNGNRFWAETDIPTITVYDNAFDDGYTGLIGSQNAAHELGHAFAQRAGRQPYNDLQGTWDNDPNFPRRADRRNGFAGNFPGWQQSRSGTANEEFADMFLGWAFNRWSVDINGMLTPAGNARAQWMTTNLADWIVLAIGQ